MGYTDSSWCSDAKSKINSRICVYVRWCTGCLEFKKGTSSSISSCESEYINASLYACQATWMVNLVEEITGKNHGAITMKIDNMSAINLAKNPIAHGRSKHIELRLHYLREQVADGKMNLEHCRTENQIADIMTKGVQVEVFRKLRAMMNIDSLDTMN